MKPDLLNFLLQDRYSSSSSGFGAKVKGGNASLEECESYIKENGNPNVISGKQEKLETIFNRYM